MNAQIESTQSLLKEARSEMQRKEIDIEALNKELNTINGQLNDYKSAHSEMKEKYSAHVERYKALEGKMEEVQHKCDNYNTSLIERNIQLQHQLKENKALQSELDVDRQRASDREQELRNTISSLEQQHTETQADHDRQHEAWNTEKVQLIKTQSVAMDEKEQSITSLQSEIAILTQQAIDDVQSHCAAITKIEADAAAEMETLEASHHTKVTALKS